MVVPTSQSGRRLREALAGEAGAILAPKFMTPGSLLHPAGVETAPDWVEQLAWLEVLEGVRDWSPYEGLFPKAPEISGKGSFMALAGEFWKLRRALQENGRTLATAARRLKDSIEEERWEALALLETKVEERLRRWQLTSRSETLSRGLALPEATVIVLAGVFELPPVLAEAFSKARVPVVSLIPAPGELAGEFDEFGRPDEVWKEEPIPWPGKERGGVLLAADAHQQAIEALRAADAGGFSSDEVALGTGDPEVGTELERIFTQAGWTAWHPTTTGVLSGLARWFTVWIPWLREPTFTAVADLLALPETGILVGGNRAGKARTLAKLCDEQMMLSPDDLKRVVEKGEFRHEGEREAAGDLAEAVEKLSRWRASLLAADFGKALLKLLEVLANVGEETATSATEIATWFENAGTFIRQSKRGCVFWIELMLSNLPDVSPEVPDDRVIDIQGWLELLHEPGRHLILCGLNEGRVPAPGGGEPWLGEAVRKELGLITQDQRVARDAFLLSAMIRARLADGRVDLICGKTSGDGDALRPSRLLLLSEPEELPSRVKLLFREIEPAEAGLVSHLDWQWKTPVVEPKERHSITSLAAYLQCPFRYYLKHALRMRQGAGGRYEWRENEFGTALHTVMERWGMDEEARDLTSRDKLEKWLSAELDRLVRETYGDAVPLAVRIQSQSLHKRLGWLARIQAGEREKGWKVTEVEKAFEISIGGALVTGKIDRIEVNERDGRIRVIDYKTGKARDVMEAHRKVILGERTFVPPHLGKEGAAFFEAEVKGKTARCFWTNLQLPLYSHALSAAGGVLVVPGYFNLGSTEGEAELKEWEDFGDDEVESAVGCAEWVVGKIRERVFWPPSERVMYEDFGDLTSGRVLADVFQPLTGDV